MFRTQEVDHRLDRGEGLDRLLDEHRVPVGHGTVPQARQLEHSPQGLALTPCSQFSDLAKMRARVVLPTPRVPVNR